MDVIFIVAGISSVVLVSWFLGFFTWLRVVHIKSRETRTLKDIESEGAATRAFIREASSHYTQSSLDRWLRQDRERRARRKRLKYGAVSATLLVGLISCLAVILSISGEPSNSTQTAESAFDSVLQQVALGNCVNFALDWKNNNYPDPSNPQIVSCASPAATFQVKWLKKDDTDFSGCPGHYSSLDWWQSDSDTTICASRIYRKGQCTQGTYWKESDYSWVSDSVIPCSSKPTKEYPFLLEITEVTTEIPEDCSDYWTISDPVTQHETSLCLSVRARYR